MTANAMAWNLQEAMNFAPANKDHNIYIFDKRSLAGVLNLLRGHVHVVIDVEFRPTGEELVSAFYDGRQPGGAPGERALGARTPEARVRSGAR
jgi:hypothetical protein